MNRQPQLAPQLAALDLAGFLGEFWPVLVPVVLGLAGVYILLPRARRMPAVWGGMLAGAAVVTAGRWLIRFEAVSPESILFYAFALLAVVAAGLMVTQSNPVYAALAFAVVVLSTCGLFLLLAAPFLMAATVIVYAGAIVVTFLFVIMLAQQHGPSSADQRSREPFLASLAGFVLLGAALCTLQRSYYITSRPAGEDPSAAELLRDLRPLLTKAALGSRARHKEEMDGVVVPVPAGDEGGEHEATLFRKYLKTLPEPKEEGKLKDLLRPLRDELDLADQGWARKWPKPDKKAEVESRVAEARASFEKIMAAAEPLRKHLEGAVLVPGKVALSPYSSGPAPAARDAEGRKQLPSENVAALGRVLFTDYLLAFEVAGLLLLVATIGAIVIAARRTEVLK
jgi:NADH-quinone oxidoreductase subunit J